MDKNDFWTTVRNKGDADDIATVGAVKTALIFGAAVIAFAIVVTPMLSSRTDRMSRDGGARFDGMTTGAIPSRPERGYTIRRSITQPMPDALCIIDDNGSHRGAC